MIKDNKKAGFMTTINLGIIISILTTIVIFMVPLEKSTTKFIIALLIGSIIGFLIALVMYLNRKLGKLMMHDELTGLFNSNFLEECKYRVIAQTDRQQTRMGLVVADVKQLNEIIGEYGNKVGDEVLRYVGEGLSTTSRASEFIFRLDSDSFLIFFADINEYSNIKTIKARLETFFQKPLQYKELVLDVKLDFGFAVYPEDGGNFEEVRDVAQQRLYVEQSRVDK